MSWRRVYRPLQVAVAHGSLLLFTIALLLKLHRSVNSSWWFIFSPLWLLHSVVARGRFSIPATSMPHGRNWAPLHAIVATPLLVAFELMLCEHLQRNNAVNLKIVFLPLLALEILILVDNIRMCDALLPRDGGSINREAVGETLPHFWIAFSMVFFISATTFTLLKLCGDVAALGWWDLFINYCVAECFAFLVCTKWYTTSNQRHALLNAASSSSVDVRYVEFRNTVFARTEANPQQSIASTLQEIASYLMTIPLLGFQVMLFMYLEGTPPGAAYLPIPVIFSPLLLLQGCWFLYYTCILIDKIGRTIHHGSSVADASSIPPRPNSVGFLGWWSIEEGSQEEQAHLYYKGKTGYNTFTPDEVKKMAKGDLIDEIQKLQSALAVQRQSTKISQDEFDKLQTEKIICQVCFDRQISIVLLPCRHRILCSECSVKCQKCPVCRVFIVDHLAVKEA